MSDQPRKADHLLDHEYDGIREYDNPTPGWWTMIFLATVVWSVLYLMWYHLPSRGRSVYDRYDAAVARNLEVQFAGMGELAPTEATLLEQMQMPDRLLFGKSIFEAQCVSCHQSRGEGDIGPNLTDDHYKSVTELEDLITVVNEGAGDGAMPAWRNRLLPNEVVLVSAYVASLRGQNVEGKQPEGEIIPPWPGD